MDEIELRCQAIGEDTGMKGIPQLKLFADKFRKVFERAIGVREMTALGEEATRILVRRTRLGQTSKRTYGVNQLGEIKEMPQKLKAHRPSYTAFRSRYSDKLHSLTAVKRSNLTFSGQLLASIGVRKVSVGNAVIGADDSARKDIITGKPAGFTNEKLSKWVTEQGRPFLELSAKDDQKLVRFYRRTFGDLVRRSGI